MAKFRNVSGVDRNLGRPDGPVVRAGDVAIVDGEVTSEIDDAYIVGEGGASRAWPKETWQLIKETRAAGKGSE